MSLPAAAWYADPHDPTQIRWWDGNVWSEHVRELPGAPAVPTVPEPVAAPVAITPPAAPEPVAAPLAVTAPVAPSPFADSSAAELVAEPVTPAAQPSTPTPMPSAPAEIPRPFAGLPPISPAADPRSPIAPSPFGPLASTTAVAPLEPPRAISTAPVTSLEPSRSFTVDPIEPIDPIKSVAPLEPPRTFSPPHVIPFEPLAAADSAHSLPVDNSPSIGAALLAPMDADLPSTPPPGAGSGNVSIKPHGAGRRVRFALVAALVIVVAAGGGMVAMGQLGSITGGDTPKSSSTAVTQYGFGNYHFEAPTAWTPTTSAVTPFDLGFKTPQGAEVLVFSSVVDTDADLTDEALLDALYTQWVESEGTSYPGYTLANQSDVTLGSTHAYRLTFTGTNSLGEPARTIETHFFGKQQRSIVVALTGSEAALTDPDVFIEYQTLLESFRFD
jgi:hypothetical protein